MNIFYYIYYFFIFFVHTGGFCREIIMGIYFEHNLRGDGVYIFEAGCFEHEIAEVSALAGF